jgi:hypothetical protein
MSDLDGPLHAEVIASFLERGHAPSSIELAAALDADPVAIAASLRRLDARHGLVLHPGTAAIWLAHPFSTSPTTVCVTEGDRSWWAPCLWCAAGVIALVEQLRAAASGEAVARGPAIVHARWGGEHEPLVLAPDVSSDPLVHFSAPPRDAWSNVVHWCATVQPFRTTADIDAWCERHRQPRGEAVPWSQVLALGRAWYGNHRARDWRKWTTREASAIFASVGLATPFWQLPESDVTF